MSGASHGGKGDNPRPFSVTQEQFNERFDAIDWNRRARESGCPQCGSTHMHACTGRPMQPWTECDKQRLRDAMASIDAREQEQGP